MGMETGSNDWSKLAFVMQWNTLNKQTKDFYFGEYFSYELSFFIKRRDPSYFEKVARRFIANRMEKSFIDHYLIDDDK
jgi:superfamily I DNA and RNA helicase